MTIINRSGLEEVIYKDKHFYDDSAHFWGCPRTFLREKYVKRALSEVDYLAKQSKIWGKTALGLIGKPSETLRLQRLINVRSTEVHVREHINIHAPEETEIISSAHYHFKINRTAETNIFAIVAHHSKESGTSVPYIMSCVIVPIEGQVYVPLTAEKGHKCRGDFLIKDSDGARISDLARGLNSLTKTHMHRIINLLNLYKARVLGIYNNNTQFKKLG